MIIANQAHASTNVCACVKKDGGFTGASSGLSSGETLALLVG